MDNFLINDRIIHWPGNEERNNPICIDSRFVIIYLINGLGWYDILICSDILNVCQFVVLTNDLPQLQLFMPFGLKIVFCHSWIFHFRPINGFFYIAYIAMETG